MADWTLFYDGGCKLCHASQLRVERWARRKGQPLRVEVLQSAEAIEKGYLNDGMVLEAEQVFTGADAWIRMMEIAPFPLSLVHPFSKFPPFRFCARLGYNLVARFRYRLFGKRTCGMPNAGVEAEPGAPLGR